MAVSSVTKGIRSDNNVRTMEPNLFIFAIPFIALLYIALLARRSRWLVDPNFPDEPFSRLYDGLARKEITKLRKDQSGDKRKVYKNEKRKADNKAA